MSDATKTLAREAVIGALDELLDELGADHGAITDDSFPIGDLGLDSADGIDFACRLSDKLRVEVPNDANPFVDDEKVCARTVKQIIEFAGELLRSQEVRSHE